MLEKNSQKKEELDRAGRLILAAAVADDHDIEAAASAPFLFTRVKGAIAAEQRQQEESALMPLILVARRVIPAMALMALLAAVLTFWPISGSRSVTTDEEVLFGPAEPGVEQAVLASRNGLSRDEVFNIIVDRNYGVKSK